MKRLYSANNARIEEIITAVYSYAIDGETVNYGKLLRTINKRTAEKLERHTNKIKKEIPKDYKTEFPFSVSQFDKLNRLQATKAELILTEVETAFEEETMIKNHLQEHAKRCVDETVKEFDLKSSKSKSDATIAALVGTTIGLSVVGNHIKTANREAQILQQSLVRKASLTDIALEVTAYAERTSTNNSDRLFFTEGTRVTNEADTLPIKEENPQTYFKSVCVHDDKACSVCLKIEAEQAEHPVRIEDMMTGVNAPPFHPYCRCHVEVIEDEDKKD